jgi:hypothetical protein
MNRPALELCAGLLLLGLMPGAALANVPSNLNQSNYAETGHSVLVGPLAQTFTPSKSGMLSRVGLDLGTDATASINGWIESVDGAGMPDDAAILAGGSASVGAGSSGWVYFSFSPPIPVAAGTKYAIVVASDDTITAYGSTDTYPGGQAYGKDGPWYPMSDPADLAFHHAAQLGQSEYHGRRSHAAYPHCHDDVRQWRRGVELLGHTPGPAELVQRHWSDLLCPGSHGRLHF